MQQKKSFLNYTPNFSLFKITNSKQEITNPSQYLKIYLHGIGLLNVPPKQYYRQVVNNSFFKTEDAVKIINKLLQVSNNVNRTLAEIISVFYRYMYNANFAKLVDKIYDGGQKVNLFWSDKRVENELNYCDYAKKIDYLGEISLPPNCALVTNHKQIKNIAIQMDNCIDDYWRKLVEKECFIIQMSSPTKVSFCISINPYMQWFNITEAKGYKNSKVKVENVSLLAKCITSNENQSFFSQNTNLTKIAAVYFTSPVSMSLKRLQPECRKSRDRANNNTFKEQEKILFDDEVPIPKKQQPFVVFNNSVFYTEGLMNFMSKLDKSTLYDILKADSEEIVISDAILDLLLERFLKRANINFENISLESKEKINVFEYNFKNFLASANSYILLDKLQKNGVNKHILTITKSIENNENLKALSTFDDSTVVEYLSNKGFCIINKKHSYTLYHLLCDIFGFSYFTPPSQLATYVKNYARTTNITI